MENTPRRRWFRFAFSLRTLFVVVTIFGVWLGWQVRVVHERKSLLSEAKREIDPKGRFLKRFDDWNIKGVVYGQLPYVRQQLGDVAIFEILLLATQDASLIERIERAFPESKIVIIDVPSGDRIATRDSLYLPVAQREPNTGTIFKTGLTEK
jgi:hypothetical protein